MNEVLARYDTGLAITGKTAMMPTDNIQRAIRQRFRNSTAPIMKSGTRSSDGTSMIESFASAGRSRGCTSADNLDPWQWKNELAAPAEELRFARYNVVAEMPR